MKLNRDVWLGLTLLFVLVVVTIVGALQAQATDVPFSSLSTEPAGTRALRSWLATLDYTVSHDVRAVFEPPAGADIILLIQPQQEITAAEWRLLDLWLEEGGTLLLAGNNTVTARAMQHLDISLDLLGSRADSASMQTPLFVDPVVESPESLTLQVDLYFRELPDDAVTHIAVGERPIVVSVARGRGRAILTTAVFPFSNLGLKQAGNPALVLNLVTAAGPSPRIWFDEWHHGLRSEEALGPVNWVRRTPIGQALLLAAAILFVTLLVNGRRFGRPVPLARSKLRRAPLEYVSALANLSRLAGHHPAALAHYRLQLKRGLGRRYRLNPTLPDEEFVARLADFNPDLDRPALAALLSNLRRRQVSDAELVRLGAAVADWLDEP